MLKMIWQRSQQHVLAIAIFLLVSVIYCLPAMKGMVVNQSDGISWRAMAQQSFEYKDKYGHFPEWTNSMFSGMPAFQIAGDSKYPFGLSLGYVNNVLMLGLPQPANYFFLSCLVFYFLCVVLGVRTWLGIFGAIAYAFSSYNAIIVSVGHMTKFASMAYIPGVVAGFLLLTQKKYIEGFIASMLFTCLLIYQNHIQVAYYSILIMVCMAIAYALHAIRKKELRQLLLVGGLSLGAAALAGISFSAILMPLNEYGKETMRGGRSELTMGKKQEVKTSGGLDKDYAFKWSYGIDETLTLALPAFKGGSSGPTELGQNGKAVEGLIESAQKARIPENYLNQLYGLLSAYWGPQTSGTSGPVYFGCLIILLTIAALFLVRDWNAGWLIAASLFGFILSWGSNLSTVNYFLFDHLPFYNKFRSPSMALIIPQFTFAVMAVLGLQKILYSEMNTKELLVKLKPALYITAALGLLLTAFYFTADFSGPTDKDRKQVMTNAFTQILGQQSGNTATAMVNSVFTGLKADRRSLYGRDLMRFWIFTILGCGVFYFFLKGKIKASYVTILSAALLLIDLIGVDLRYLDKKNYISEEEFLLPLEPNAADLEVKKDTGYYRVFDQVGGDPFNSSRGANHHNLINGYHPAKLALYQDLIEYQIGKNNMAVMNMLNTKYFLADDPQSGQPVVYANPDALGPCWLVRNIKYVNTADEEMNALNAIRPLDTAYIRENERSKVKALPGSDSLATLKFLYNKNDSIRYVSSSSAPQFAVFSEIYYPHGWKTFIDGKESEIVKVDYCFRGLSLPSGQHTIDFKFEPASKAKGDLISYVMGNVTFAIFIGGLFWSGRRSWKEQLLAHQKQPAKKNRD